jgi:hypothetical protein
MVILGTTAMWGQSIAFTPPLAKPTAVTGAPYSGEEEYVHGGQVQKGRKLYRDSEGRMRSERPLSPGSNQYIVEIIDPVLGANWVLDTQHKVAHLMMPQPLPPVQPVPPAPPPTTLQAPAAPPKVTVEQLQPKEIEHIKVNGTRTTTVFPGGNTAVSESWMSPELQVYLLQQSGADIFRLANVSRNEPFPSLFRVPADYTIIEEKTTFIVQFQ